MKNCICTSLDSLAYAAHNFNYFLETQAPGSVLRVGGTGKDVRDSPVYLKSLKILKPLESSLEDSEGTVCPYLVLLRGITASCSSGKSTCEVSREVVEILSHVTVGAIAGNEDIQLTDSTLDRLQGRISGRLVPNWMEG